MAINVVLQDEHGRMLEQVVYPMGLPDTFIPYDDESFPCLGYVDPYGDTLFNQIQMKPFLIDWQRLYGAASSEVEMDFLRQVEMLAHKCQTGVGLYLRLLGD